MTNGVGMKQNRPTPLNLLNLLDVIRRNYDQIGLINLKNLPNKKLMEVQSETLLTKYAEHEKVAYLGALAGLATADREASDQEVEHLREIAHAAGLSAEDEKNILEAAKDASGNDFEKTS